MTLLQTAALLRRVLPTAALRLLALTLALAYSALAGPAALAAGTKAHAQKALRLRIEARDGWLAVVKLRRVAVPLTLGQRAVAFAKRYLGAPYVYGGSTPSGFDCSGFVRFVYERFGIDLPHSSYADFDLGRRVARGELKPGDLVFFDGVGHVGLYVGNGRFIHAPHTGSHVEIDALASYGASYDGARRVVHA